VRDRHVSSESSGGPVNLLKVAQAWIRTRRLRYRYLNPDLLGEPGWDILLDLYQAYCLRHQRFIGQVGEAANIAPSTTLRWVSVLDQRGLIERFPDATDGRRVRLSLTPRGVEKMEAVLAAAVNKDGRGLGGLAIVQ
jgi:DNA-binding MarR family transcriptional regulator